MIDQQITRRFESEAAFQEEKLRNLFRVMFRDETEAWDRWKIATERRGFKQAQAMLKDNPARFGKLQGKARLGFLKNRAFDEREIPELIARLDSLREKGIITEQEFQQKKAELLRKLE